MVRLAAGDWTPDLTTNRLLIQLDRTQAPSNLWLSVTGVGDPAAELLAGFYNNDLIAVVAPITLHIVEAPGIFTNIIPIPQTTAASIISLSATNSMLRILSATLETTPFTPTVDTQSSKPMDAPANPIPAAKAIAAPSPAQPAKPLTSTLSWYVNGSSGSDSYDGKASANVPATTTGPKQTLDAVLPMAAPGDTIYIAPGVYSKHVNSSKFRFVTTGRVVLQ